MNQALRRARSAIITVVAVVLLSCGTQISSGSDSSTHWFSPCSSDGDCGALACVCNVCTKRCTSTAACSDSPGTAECAPLGSGACVESARVCVPTGASTGTGGATGNASWSDPRSGIDGGAPAGAATSGAPMPQPTLSPAPMMGCKGSSARLADRWITSTRTAAIGSPCRAAATDQLVARGAAGQSRASSHNGYNSVIRDRALAIVPDIPARFDISPSIPGAGARGSTAATSRRSVRWTGPRTTTPSSRPSIGRCASSSRRVRGTRADSSGSSTPIVARGTWTRSGEPSGRRKSATSAGATQPCWALPTPISFPITWVPCRRRDPAEHRRRDWVRARGQLAKRYTDSPDRRWRGVRRPLRRGSQAAFDRAGSWRRLFR